MTVDISDMDIFKSVLPVGPGAVWPEQPDARHAPDATDLDGLALALGAAGIVAPVHNACLL